MKRESFESMKVKKRECVCVRYIQKREITRAWDGIENIGKIRSEKVKTFHVQNVHERYKRV